MAAVVVAPDIVDPHDMGVVEAGGQPGFLLKTGDERGLIVVVGVQHFDGDGAAEPRVDGLIDACHAAVAERPDDAIASVKNKPPLQNAHAPPLPERAGRARTPAIHATTSYNKGMSCARQVVAVQGSRLIADAPKGDDEEPQREGHEPRGHEVPSSLVRRRVRRCTGQRGSPYSHASPAATRDH